MNQDFLNAVEFSHFLLEKYAVQGGYFVDATSGNGKDTKFLAELAGTETDVLAFDIQEDAVNRTKENIEAAGLSDKVSIYHDSHSNIDGYISENNLAAVVYNLGYLPGGDKKITTEAETTIKALKKNLELLKKYGIIILVIYTGHPGGKKEKEAVLEFTSELNYKKYNVLHYDFINQKSKPPEVIALIKRA